MTFTSFAILAGLLTIPAAQAGETCSQMGSVSLPSKSLFWGTTAQSNAMATPIGWSTSARAPNDTSGHGILAVRASTSPTLWGAFDCAGVGGGVVNPRSGGGTTSGPPSGSGGRPGASGGGGGASGGANGLVNFFGAIADSASNLCLTASFDDLSNMTITRAACIQPLNSVPDATQAWQWSTSETQHVVVPTKLDSLAFIGTQSQSVLPIGSATNYVPTLVGTGVGAYVALKRDVGGLNPANAATEPGLLVSFAPAA
ncbi:hypothetical protein GGX14DRAFT_660911 [Mycena pura]|uniref:Uncharacterized protein n=1 Tax=Mycena pura TaxID=153505 RepID=A0AAD6YAZ8_9AGAR|nr:hypothetical protein GGX14DRAFT_660911 [Mycena pura]